MYKVLLFTLCTSFLISAITAAKQPDPLPIKFTQAWTTMYIDEPYATGKIFYDFESKSQKINIIDGSDQPTCGFIDGIHECSLMESNSNVYLIAPEVKKCCYDSTDYEFTPRQVFDDFTYAGQVILDSVSYEKWILDFDFFGQLRFILINEKTRPGVMRRFGLAEQQDESDAGWFQFWPNSYTDKFSSKVAFEVPNYCVNFDKCDLDMQQALKKSTTKGILLSFLKVKNKEKKSETLRQQ